MRKTTCALTKYVVYPCCMLWLNCNNVDHNQFLREYKVKLLILLSLHFEIPLVLETFVAYGEWIELCFDASCRPMLATVFGSLWHQWKWRFYLLLMFWCGNKYRSTWTFMTTYYYVYVFLKYCLCISNEGWYTFTFLFVWLIVYVERNQNWTYYPTWGMSRFQTTCDFASYLWHKKTSLILKMRGIWELAIF